MKKSKKILVAGLATAMGIVAATAATSGAAWFTTQRTVSVGVADFAAAAAEGNIQIKFKNSTFGLTSSASDFVTDALTLSVPVDSDGKATKVLTDVTSGNGVDFYKVNLSNDATPKVTSVRAKETAQKNSLNDDLYNFADFTLTVGNTEPTGAGLNVFISKVTDKALFIKKSTSTKDLSSAYRLAIFNTTGDVAPSNSNCVFFYTNDGQITYFDSTCTPVDGVCTANEYDDDTYMTGVGSPLFSSITTAPSGQGGKSATPAKNNQLLAANLTNTPVDLTFRVWIEGSDSVATTDNAVGLVQMNFNIVALVSE